MKHLFPPEYIKSLKEAARRRGVEKADGLAADDARAMHGKRERSPENTRAGYTSRRSLPPSVRSRGVKAILGPTNTGKTHLAIERMLARGSGMIGLPLRLLAREVYQRVAEKAGLHNVALVTGEEKIKPDRPRYWISTVEAMPRDLELEFVAVDEIQLAADFDRGHVFTDRILNQRGTEETLLIGSGTMRPILESLIPGIHVTTRPRLSTLSFSGEKKITRLPRRSAIVAFSAEEVYAIAELIRRQRGGAAVVLGALSPRTRNAQVELYQSGEVDYLVATDAIGMGLNLDIDHVAFASDRKFDGFKFRKLFPAELAQIAGRAGRYLRDGTFGTAGRCPPFDAETVSALENHAFDPVQILQWRNPDLDFSSLEGLRASLARSPTERGLVPAPVNEDVLALENVSREGDIRRLSQSSGAVERLWEVCQVPDYRKISAQGHADLVATLYRFLMEDGTIPDDWYSRQLALVDRTDGDIDTLSNRIAQVRTWSFVANRPDWLTDPEHWQSVARQVEDNLSDALHERLAQRFVDRRTSVLMRRLRENAMLEAQISTAGEVTVEGQHVGHIHGFQFVPESLADTVEAKTLRNAAEKALAGEIEARAERFSAAADSSLVISNDGTVRWTGEPVAKLEPGDKIYEPQFRLIADDQLAGAAREKVETRLHAWLKAHIVRLLGPAMQLEEATDLTGIARGIAFQLCESLGVLERSRVLQDVRSLDQDARGLLRRLGVRFGAYHLYLPALLKPAPRTLATQLWALKNGGLDQKGIDEIALLANSGRTSIPMDPEISASLYLAAGFRICGMRAVRVDILERLADLIRPAIAYRPGVTPGEPPAGTADGNGFVVTVAMTSLVGCAGEEFASILKSLGYASETKVGPAITVPLIPAAPIPGIIVHAADQQPPTTAEAAAQSDSAPDAGETIPAGTAPVISEPAVPVADAGADAGQAAGGEMPETVTIDETTSSVNGDGEAPVEEMAEAVATSADVLDAGADMRTAEDDAGQATGGEVPETVTVDETASSVGGDGEVPVEEMTEAETSADASVETAAESDPVEAETAEEAAPAEPETIEVWHQQRHHGGQRHGQHRHQHHAKDGAGRRTGDNREERQQRPPRPDRERRNDNRPRGGKRPDKRDAGRERTFERKREDHRERQPDPDSPFAKLLALKSQLQEDKS